MQKELDAYPEQVKSLMCIKQDLDLTKGEENLEIWNKVKSMPCKYTYIKYIWPELRWKTGQNVESNAGRVAKFIFKEKQIKTSVRNYSETNDYETLMNCLLWK